MPSVVRPSQRNHQFDLLRIIFAVMVLLSHAPELTDGNRSREILSRLTTPDFSFGTLGVDGFFLLSGYLIVKSWVNRPDVGDFMKKRFLRIAPGYALAMFLSIIVIGFLAPGTPHFFRFQHMRLDVLKSLFFIFPPIVPPVFPGNPYPTLNGSLWTILYEFRCYVIVAVLGMLGLLKRRRFWGGQR